MKLEVKVSPPAFVSDDDLPEGAQVYSLLQAYYFCGTPTEKV